MRVHTWQNPSVPEWVWQVPIQPPNLGLMGPLNKILPSFQALNFGFLMVNLPKNKPEKYDFDLCKGFFSMEK